MSKYDKLTEYLKNLDATEWHASFDDIERVLKFSLPASAFDYQAWWANQSGGGHTQSAAWQDAGWKTENLDLDSRTVTFVRKYGNALAGAMNALSGDIPAYRQTGNALAGTEIPIPVGNALASIPAADFRLTISQAKAGLAATFGVPIECIEIIIKA